jgi:hypothetical protein
LVVFMGYWCAIKIILIIYFKKGSKFWHFSFMECIQNLQYLFSFNFVLWPCSSRSVNFLHLKTCTVS